MAIFGKLSDFSLREIVSVIGRRSGVLLIEADNGQCLRLQLSGERITRVSVERTIESTDEASQLLKRFAHGQGSFHFDSQSDDSLRQGPLQLDWQNFLAPPHEGLSESADLPHPETRFMLIKGRNVSLDPALEKFLQQSGSLLEQSASPLQISEELGLPLEMVRRRLQQLREVKKVWPVRAHLEPSDSAQQAEKTSLAQRLVRLILK